MQNNTKKMLLFLGLIIVFIPINYFLFMNEKDDNAVEELEEDVIKGVTGIDIDLTPDSKEK